MACSAGDNISIKCTAADDHDNSATETFTMQVRHRAPSLSFFHLGRMQAFCTGVRQCPPTPKTLAALSCRPVRCRCAPRSRLP
jgi:hypothetical protein